MRLIYASDHEAVGVNSFRLQGCDVPTVRSMVATFLKGVRKHGWRVLCLGVCGREVRNVVDSTNGDVWYWG